MIEVAVISVRNGDVPLHTGDVFRSAYDVRFDGEGLKKYENPPIFENEVEVHLFVEAIHHCGGGSTSSPRGTPQRSTFSGRTPRRSLRRR